MSISITVKNSFQAIMASRPVSHAAAVALLGTSIVAVHEGAKASGLPGDLIAGATAAICAVEWAQWTALGRLSKIEDANDDRRAVILKGQSLGIGALQVTLYTFAVLALAGRNGLDWTHGAAPFAVVAGAALYAALNFVFKWTSCDPLAASGPTGGQRASAHTAVFGPARTALPNFSNDDTVVSFDLEKSIRTRGELEAKDDRHRATHPDQRSVADRLRLSAKRVRVRNLRAAERKARIRVEKARRVQIAA